jgi:hypothetical protein
MDGERLVLSLIRKVLCVVMCIGCVVGLFRRLSQPLKSSPTERSVGLYLAVKR